MEEYDSDLSSQLASQLEEIHLERDYQQSQYISKQSFEPVARTNEICPTDPTDLLHPRERSGYQEKPHTRRCRLVWCSPGFYRYRCSFCWREYCVQAYRGVTPRYFLCDGRIDNHPGHLYSSTGPRYVNPITGLDSLYPQGSPLPYSPHDEGQGLLSYETLDLDFSD